MAKTIDNFLIGVGFDVDKKSMGGVTSGISSIASKALQLGSVVAGAFGIKALTRDFAAAKDELGKFANVFGVNAGDIHAFGNALRLEGGTLDGFMSQLAGLERFRAGIKVGDIGFLAEAQKAGIDTQAIIEASTATEAYIQLADQFQKLAPEMRLNAAQALGFDESAIRLLSKGRDEVESIIAKQKEMRPITDAMTDSARDFNGEYQDMKTNIGGVVDIFGEFATTNAVKSIRDLNDAFDENREGIRLNTKAAIFASGKIGQALLQPFRDLSGALFGGDDQVPAADSQAGQSVIIKPQIMQESPKQQPILIKNQTVIDGRVIDERVVKVVGEMANRAVTDLKSTEGG